MNSKELKDIFKKLKTLEFAPSNPEDLEFLLDEFKQTDKELLTKTIKEIYSTKTKFPKPAEIWAIYYKYRNEIIESKQKGIEIISWNDVMIEFNCKCKSDGKSIPKQKYDSTHTSDFVFKCNNCKESFFKWQCENHKIVMENFIAIDFCEKYKEII